MRDVARRPDACRAYRQTPNVERRVVSDVHHDVGLADVWASPVLDCTVRNPSATYSGVNAQ